MAHVWGAARRLMRASVFSPYQFMLLVHAKFHVGNPWKAIYIQRSLENLQSVVVKLKPEVALVEINDNNSDINTITASSLFMYEHAPQIKYHNPHVRLVCTKDTTKPFYVVLTRGDGSKSSIPTENRSSYEIFSELTRVYTVYVDESNVPVSVSL